MRLFIRNLLWIMALALVGGGFTACSDDETEGPVLNPTLSVEGEATSWGTAEFTVLATDIVEYAWVVLPAEEAAPEEAVVFMDGTVVTEPAAESKIDASGFVGLTDYVLYVAAKTPPTREQSNSGIMEAFYGEVIAVPFTTLDYTDAITIIRTTSEGAQIAIKYPEIAAEKIVKWGICNMAIHAMQAQPDYAFLNLNDAYYPAAIIRRDTMLNIYNDNRWVRDEKGEIIYDEWSGEANYYWEFIAPGEPLYLILSEASWGESDFGWGEGYYSFPFDAWGYEEANMDYWYGITDTPADPEAYWEEGAFHHRVAFKTDMPELYEGKVNITASDLTTKGGAITFAPDTNNPPTMYTMAVMDNTTYAEVVKTYLGGDESLMQWFISSYVAMYIVGTQTLGGAEAQQPWVLPMEEYFYADYIVPGATYHAFAVAMDGKEIYDEEWDEYYYEADPMKQSFTHLAFQLPDYKLDAPVIEVTGLEPTSAWKASFNIKCTTYASNPVVEACYAANDPSEWDMYIEYGSTYYELISQNRGYMTFGDEELKAINSEAGLTIDFDMRENETLRIGVVGWNTEGRPSNPDAEGAKAVADASSAVLADATPISSPYYESLVGDWTATATVRVNQYNYDTYNYEWVDGGEVSVPVTIGDCYVPEAMTEDVYAIYEQAGLSREAADDYFAQFKEQADIYSKKVRGQNRILCTGWGFDKHSGNPEYSDLRTKTAWDLFTDASYNAATVADLFYDFGPKWFLQVAEDGSLFVPVNMNRVPTSCAWGSYEQYLVGGNAESGYAYYLPLSADLMDDVTKWPNIPVEVSEDGNTITLKSFVEGDVTYYPNMIYNSTWSGPSFFNTAIVSEVVLTRTATTTTEPSVSVAAIKAQSQLGKNAVKAISANGATFQKEQSKAVTKVKTTLKAQPKAKKLEMKQLTPEQRNANIKMLREKMQKGARK